MSVFTNEVLVGNVVPVTGPLTDAELRAIAVPVSVSGSVAVSNFPATQPISGSVSVSNFPATQPVSGPLTDAQLRATPVPISGTVSTAQVLSNSANITRVATSTSSVLLLAANANRKRLIIYIESGAGTSFIALAATAAANAYTFAAVSSTSVDLSGYTGVVSLIRSTGTSNVQITELV